MTFFFDGPKANYNGTIIWANGMYLLVVGVNHVGPAFWYGQEAFAAWLIDIGTSAAWKRSTGARIVVIRKVHSALRSLSPAICVCWGSCWEAVPPLWIFICYPLAGGVSWLTVEDLRPGWYRKPEIAIEALLFRNTTCMTNNVKHSVFSMNKRFA